MKEFQGIFPALLTPFDKSNNVNKDQLKKLVDFDRKQGATGFYVCGSTAEAFLLSTEERKLVMETVREAAPEATLIAHVGSLNLQEAKALAGHAKALGYDAVSSVAPFYYKFTFEEIKNYYFALADEAQLPMLVYHFPAFSGVSMGFAQMGEFLNDERFMGIKYTSNDFFTLERCKTCFPDKIVYNGYDEMFLAGLSMGADGGIGSTYNFMTDRFVRIRDLFLQNKMAEAQQHQQEANAIISVLCRLGVMQAEKEVLNQLGFDFGCCRAPFGELSAQQKEEVKTQILPLLL